MQYVLRPEHSQLFLQFLVGSFGNYEEARYALTSNGFVETSANTYFHSKLRATFSLRKLKTPSEFANEIQKLEKGGMAGQEERIQPFYK